MKIKVGRVLKAQGLKGEMKVFCLLDSASMLKNVKQLYLNNTLHQVDSLRVVGEFFFVHFCDIFDRTAAENYRNSDVFCDRELLTLPEGRYFIGDVVGCDVCLDNGVAVGTVTDVLQYGAADVYVCRGEKGEVSFPFLKDLVVSVDTAGKKIVLAARRFDQVVLDSSTEEVRDED